MPSLETLKEFNKDISHIGDELNIRIAEGTVMPTVAYPDNVPTEDDSFDFEFELPTEANLAAKNSTEDNQSTEEVDLNIDDLFEEMQNGISGEPTENLLDDLELLPSELIDEPLSTGDIFEQQSTLESLDDVEQDFSVDIDSLLQKETLPVPDDIFVSDDEYLAALTGRSQPEILNDLVDTPDDYLFSDDANEDSFDFSTVEDFSEVDNSENEIFDDTLTNDFDPMADFSDFQADSSVATDVLNDDVSNLIDGLDTLSDVETDLDLDMPADDLETAPSFDLDDLLSDTPSSDGFDFEIDNSLNIDFGNEPENSLNIDFGNEPENSFNDNDFTDDDFEIPGFSDATAEISSEKTFSAAKKKNEDGQERTHLTDKEYELFVANLKSYPLNLRLAIDEVIVKEEFTDEAIMEVLLKVVKKVSARKLATHLEKMLDISINVPLNYERRTVEQYEEYKLSVEYQLKNRIIPGLLGGLCIAIFLYIFIWLGHTFVYTPLKAESLYKEGYALIENNLYVQSEIKFNEALSYKQKKKWFFEYARAYADKKQYERARNMYEHLVLRFDYDKDAGIEYARMEFEDLSNYPRAEEITKRYVLENHKNDKDAMLLLGDIYLDWATSLENGVEKEEKFELARQEYANLMHIYGQTDLYLSRMLRYFMRIDNLYEVLTLKSHFESDKYEGLDTPDLIELGGYIIQKRYGYIPPTEEYLRAHITGIKAILELTVERAPEIPEAHYNYGRYLVQTDNLSEATKAFNFAIEKFELVDKKTHERTLKHIDSYRQLGEIYTAKEEYLLAEEELGLGIRLFEYSEKNTGFESSETIGKMYQAMGDLNYFIAGDLDSALENYIQSIDNYNDNASVRYKVGYIQYNNENFSEALNSFIKSAEEESSNRNLLLSLGNVLSIRGNNSAATAQYKDLITILDADRDRYDILFPQVRVDHAEFVDLYLKASNNLGVSLVKLASETGNTSLETESFVYFSESLRAWDSLTRNQETMIRLDGTNLAEQNIKYLASPTSDYEPVIYATLPRTLFGEDALKQSSLN